MIEIAVITPSLPERTAMLGDCIRSVAAQRLAPKVHLIGVDNLRRGPAAVRNDLAKAALVSGVYWLAFLDDDDTFQPWHLEMLTHHAEMDCADVIYSAPYVLGEQWYPELGPLDLKKLRRRNYIPMCALVRMTWFVRVSGFREDVEFEDWDFWLRLAEAGARFTFLNEVTWTYRFHGANRSRLAQQIALPEVPA